MTGRKPCRRRAQAPRGTRHPRPHRVPPFSAVHVQRAESWPGTCSEDAGLSVGQGRNQRASEAWGPRDCGHTAETASCPHLLQ